MARERRPEPERIIRDPEILAGKPVVRGTRIPVELVLNYLANNPNPDELFADYPRLTVEDLRACLAFAGSSIEGGARSRARK